MMEETPNQQQTKIEQPESIAGKHYRLKSGQLIPETEYQRRVREYRELFMQTLTIDQAERALLEVEAKYHSAEDSLESPKREAEQIRAIFYGLQTLMQYFVTWQDKREEDRRWKDSVENALKKVVEQQTGILQSLETKLDALLNGDSDSQGEMMTLILGILNELRDRLSAVENSKPHRHDART